MLALHGTVALVSSCFLECLCIVGVFWFMPVALKSLLFLSGFFFVVAFAHSTLMSEFAFLCYFAIVFGVSVSHSLIPHYFSPYDNESGWTMSATLLLVRSFRRSNRLAVETIHN